MSVSLDLELDEVVRASDRPTYNTAAVEQRTRLRPATFRAWERRYDFPKPRRLPGNQRLYSDQDIAAIRWLQRRTDEGLSISHADPACSRSASVRERLSTTDAVEPGRPTADAGRGAHPCAPRRSTPARPSWCSSEAFAMYRVEEVCLGVIAPTLVDVGERWHRGDDQRGDRALRHELRAPQAVRPLQRLRDRARTRARLRRMRPGRVARGRPVDGLALSGPPRHPPALPRAEPQQPTDSPRRCAITGPTC